MSKTKKLFALLFSGAMCFSLAFAAACGGGSDSDGDGDGDGDGGTPAVQTTTATVTYDSNGGSSVDASTVEVGSTLGTLPTPTRTGYNFLGWYYTYGSMEVKVTGDYPIPCDVTLTAKWSACTDFFLGSQNYLVIETGETFYCYLYDYSNLDDDAYITITKDSTTKTEEEAESAGWITYSATRVESYYIRPYLIFGQSGDYTITGYSYGQECTAVVTVIGDTITTTNSTFTDSTVSVDKIEYLDTEYTNGSTITTASFGSVYIYFNAPKASEVKVTFANNMYSGVLGTSYSGGINTSYSNGQFIVIIYAGNLDNGFTYTVKLDSASNGSAVATFTIDMPTEEYKIISTPETSATVEAGVLCYDYYYVYSATEINGVSYSVTDTEGNILSDVGYCNVSIGYYENSIYSIYYEGYFNSEGTYKLTVAPYDSEGALISDLAHTVTVIVTASDSSDSSTYVSWSVVNTDSKGNTDNYYNCVVAGESKTIKFTANAELDKVAVCGAYINTSTATTINKYDGSTISAIYSVADGKTTLSITVKATNSSNGMRLVIYGAKSNGSASCSTMDYVNVYQTIRVTGEQKKISAAIYSLKTYFSAQIAEGGGLYEVYTKLTSFTMENTITSYVEAKGLLDDVTDAVESLEAEVFDADTDYTSSLITALESKTSLCGSILYNYNENCGGGSNTYLLGEDLLNTNYDLYLLGMERYALIETSDKDICDMMYDSVFDRLDADALISEYDEEYDGSISAVVTAHNSGTETEYVAAMNVFYLLMSAY